MKSVPTENSILEKIGKVRSRGERLTPVLGHDCFAWRGVTFSAWRIVPVLIVTYIKGQRKIVAPFRALPRKRSTSMRRFTPPRTLKAAVEYSQDSLTEEHRARDVHQYNAMAGFLHLASALKMEFSALNERLEKIEAHLQRPK